MTEDVRRGPSPQRPPPSKSSRRQAAEFEVDGTGPGRQGGDLDGTAGLEPLVTIPAREYEQLRADASSWRRHNSDEWRAYREWLLEYEIAQRIRQASYDVAGYLHPRRRPNSEAARVAKVLGALESEGWQ